MPQSTTWPPYSRIDQDNMSLKCNVKILLNARVFIINNAFSVEGDGHLLEATLFSNVLAIIYRI